MFSPKGKRIFYLICFRHAYSRNKDKSLYCFCTSFISKISDNRKYTHVVADLNFIHSYLKYWIIEKYTPVAADWILINCSYYISYFSLLFLSFVINWIADIEMVQAFAWSGNSLITSLGQLVSIMHLLGTMTLPLWL